MEMDKYRVVSLEDLQGKEGKLGHVRHELNNVLCTVIANSEMILSGDIAPDEVQSVVKRIFLAGLRGRDIVKKPW
jgi:hypothetical protein